MAARYDWSFLNNFVAPTSESFGHGWSELGQWVGLAERSARERIEGLPELVRDWDRRLAWLAADAASRDWSDFRPLRLEREEHWSDWLYELLRSSRAGVLAHRLFGQPGERPEQFVMPRVTREVTVMHGERRADLLIEWQRGGGYAHVEVKVGDESFLKTFETALGLRAGRPGVWRDFILLPEESVETWREVVEKRRGAGPAIAAVTWSDVALSIRRSLWIRAEDSIWSAWAVALLGAIESRLIGIRHAHVAPGTLTMNDLAGAVRWLKLLQDGREEGTTR